MTVLQNQIERLRTQRAAEWLQIVRENAPGAHAEFVRWIGESPRNLEEFLTLEALSRETAAVLREAQFDLAALSANGGSQVLQLENAVQARSGLARRRRISPRGFASLAASLGALLLVGLWAYGRLSAWDHYTTDDGRQKTVQLADGSRVYLNAGSALEVRLGHQARELRLLRGEGLFDVARDKQRPFRVSTHDAVVEAVGTQFNVETQAAGTVVAVIEGRVRITRGAQPDPAAPANVAALAAGEMARVTRAGAIERSSTADVAKAAAWSQPELIFEGTSLEEAVEQFNRHRRSKHLRLEGIAPGSHHYTGIFNAADADSFAALLARERDLEVRVGPDEILIKDRS